MRYADLPTTEDFEREEWAYVIDLGDESPYSWRRSAYISTGMTSVINQEDKGSISLERIVSVEAFHAISTEGYGSMDLCGLFKLTDGWATVMAWCDTTGWDCRSDGQWKWAATREEAIENGLGKEERASLGLSLPHETHAGGAA